MRVVKMMQLCLHTSPGTSEDAASDSIPQRLNRDDIMELVLDPDSDGDISDCDRRV